MTKKRRKTNILLAYLFTLFGQTRMAVLLNNSNDDTALLLLYKDVSIR